MTIKPVLEAILDRSRASARQGAIQMPTLNQLAGPPARIEAMPMFKLTLQVGKSFKITIAVPASVVLLVLSMLA